MEGLGNTPAVALGLWARGRNFEILTDRKLFEQPAPLGYESQALAASAVGCGECQIGMADADRAGCRTQQPHDGIHRRVLPTPLRPSAQTISPRVTSRSSATRRAKPEQAALP
jgi:hypothetical protein